jgi:DNA-binding NtrC family response regulator
MKTMDNAKRKVLIIEDEPIPRGVLKTAFLECEEMQFEVSLAENARQADKLIVINEFDVVTVDLRLGSNPEAGLLWMQKQMLFSSCPGAVKIVVTAFSDLENVLRAMRAGAWDFIAKEGEYEGRTVKSAMARLKELAEAERVEKALFEEWLPKNERQWQKDFPGEYLAIDGEGAIVAHGKSRIELGENLPVEWLKGGGRPYILQLGKGPL